MKRLPPFFALRALEAAARNNSYSRAARELGVTHGAVSQQIRRLEAELGARLFERRGNEMIATPKAARLASGVARSLAGLQDAVDEFAAADERDPLAVSLDPQFSNRWLATRLPKLLADPAGANLKLWVEDRIANFVTDERDMALRYGDGRWPGVEARRVFPEFLFPVCSPQMAAKHPVRTPADLLSVPLLHGYWPWTLWFSAFGLEAPPQVGPYFDNSTMLLSAAAEGLGYALGRSVFAEIDLTTGRLVRPLREVIKSPMDFYAVWRADCGKSARIAALADWIEAEAARGGDLSGDAPA